MIENDELKRTVTGKAASPQEEAFDRSLRPRELDEYIGQEKIRNQLGIFIEAARKRGESLDHVLLFGPPGLGKTTLSHILAHELGVNLRQTSGPVLERPGDLVTREELQKRLWPETFVDVERNLNTAVNKIRDVLSDSAENPPNSTL